VKLESVHVGERRGVTLFIVIGLELACDVGSQILSSQGTSGWFRLDERRRFDLDFATSDDDSAVALAAKGVVRARRAKGSLTYRVQPEGTALICDTGPVRWIARRNPVELFGG
jgi:hypothetical protein